MFKSWQYFIYCSIKSKSVNVNKRFIVCVQSLKTLPEMLFDFKSSISV